MPAASNGGRGRKAAEGREMTHSPPPPGFPIPLYQRAGAAAPAPAPPLNLESRLDQPGAPPRFPNPPPLLNPQLHLDQPGASSSMAQRPYNNDVVSEVVEEMCKRQYAIEGLKNQMETVLANYRTQALTMAERLKALQVTNAALNVALHVQPTPPAACNQGGGGGDAAEGQVVVVKIRCRICWKEPATVMGWPCRHLCLCNNCARSRASNRCPICPATFQDFIEVKFY